MTPRARHYFWLSLLAALFVVGFEADTYLQHWFDGGHGLVLARSRWRDLPEPNVVLEWSYLFRDRLIVATPIVLAVPVALGEGWWVLRFCRALAALALVCLLNVSVCHWLGLASWATLTTSTYLLVFLPALATATGVFAILRWATGWRLIAVEQRPGAAESRRARFTLRQLMEVVALVAIACACVRICHTEPFSIWEICQRFELVPPWSLMWSGREAVCMVPLVVLILWPGARLAGWLTVPVALLLDASLGVWQSQLRHPLLPTTLPLGRTAFCFAIVAISLLLVRWAGYRLIHTRDVACANPQATRVSSGICMR